MARERGIDAIVDAAHSVGQLDFKLPDLKADFIGINLHKWIGAPLGVGAIYVRRDRFERDRSRPGRKARRAADILTRGPYRHARLCGPADRSRRAGVPGGDRRRPARGPAAGAARPLGPRGREPAPGPDSDARRSRVHGAITVFPAARPDVSHEDNVALAKTLLDKHRIFTVHRDGLASRIVRPRHAGAGQPDERLRRARGGDPLDRYFSSGQPQQPRRRRRPRADRSAPLGPCSTSADALAHVPLVGLLRAVAAEASRGSAPRPDNAPMKRSPFHCGNRLPS